MSTDFLLNNGDRNLRHNVGTRGQLLWFTFFMSLVGFLYLIFKRRIELYIFPIWFLLFPIPASLTWEGLPHAGRSICGLPVFEILAAVGFVFILSSIKKLFLLHRIKIAIIIFLMLLFIAYKGLLDLKNYLQIYFTKYSQHSAGWFEYNTYAISKATEHMKEYDIIIMPFDFAVNIFLYLQKIDPEKWQRKEFHLKYIKEFQFDSSNYNQKIARIVTPGLYPEEETIGKVYNETTNNVMYEIKRVKTIVPGDIQPQLSSPG